MRRLRLHTVPSPQLTQDKGFTTHTILHSDSKEAMSNSNMKTQSVSITELSALLHRRLEKISPFLIEMGNRKQTWAWKKIVGRDRK